MRNPRDNNMDVTPVKTKNSADGLTSFDKDRKSCVWLRFVLIGVVFKL
jgi:hypothetical protein